MSRKMNLKFSWRIWLFIIVLIMSVVLIFGMPPAFFQKGVAIKSVDSNSTAFDSGLRQGQVITSIDGKSVSNVDDYAKFLEGKFVSNQSVKTIVGTKGSEF